MIVVDVIYICNENSISGYTDIENAFDSLNNDFMICDLGDVWKCY